jgi:hypothetical protein
MNANQIADAQLVQERQLAIIATARAKAERSIEKYYQRIEDHKAQIVTLDEEAATVAAQTFE